MMKTAKWISVALMGTLAAMSSGCAADEEMRDNATEGTGKLMTIMVGTESGSNTRVSYDEGQDDTPSLTWELNDKLAVVGHNADGVFKGKKDYLLDEADHGETIGAFTGEEIAEAEIYNVYYPHTVVNELGIPGFTIGEQIQVGDNSTAHLKNNIFLQSASVTSLNNITLSMRSSILKFALSGIPKEVGTLKELRWVVETASGEKILKLAFSTASANKIQFSDTKSDLIAYLGFMPDDMSVKPGGMFKVVLVGDKIYQASTTIADGKSYVAGHRYTASIDGEAGTMKWEPRPTITVKTTVAKDAGYDYDGLPIIIGSLDSSGNSAELARAIINNSEATFDASIFTTLPANSDLWFCIPKVVKFIYTPGRQGLDSKLVLPDKDAGSTLHPTPQAGGNSYVNEWIVALYMGVNEGGSTAPDAAPIYWATGNLIATKVNGLGEASEVRFHIAGDDESDTYLMGDNDAVDGYKNRQEGTQWIHFVWNSTSPASTILNPIPSVPDSGEISGTNQDICFYGLNKGFRLPLGSKTTENPQHREMSLFIKGAVQDLSYEQLMSPAGILSGYKSSFMCTNGIKNTLKLNMLGYVYCGSPTYNQGSFWSGTGVTDNEGMQYNFSFTGVNLQTNFMASNAEYRYTLRPVTK